MSNSTVSATMAPAASHAAALAPINPLAQHGTFRFLNLPAELRIHIYGDIAVPFNANMESYKGLYLSCQQIKKEMDQECTEVMKKHVLQLQASIEADEKARGYRIYYQHDAVQFSNVRHIHVVLRLNAFAPQYDELGKFISPRTTAELNSVITHRDRPYLPRAFLALMGLHLDMVTFVQAPRRDFEITDQRIVNWENCIAMNRLQSSVIISSLEGNTYFVINAQSASIELSCGLFWSWSQSQPESVPASEL